MNVNFEYKTVLDDIVTEVLRSEKLMETEQAETMAAIGKEIKKEVVKLLPKSDEGGGDYKHMREDVKVEVKDKKTGTTGVIVRGGKKTAYKWHMLDDGTRNPDGSIHTPAKHFTREALNAATPSINKILDDLERKVANDGR